MRGTQLHESIPCRLKSCQQLLFTGGIVKLDHLMKIVQGSNLNYYRYGNGRSQIVEVHYPNCCESTNCSYSTVGPTCQKCPNRKDLDIYNNLLKFKNAESSIGTLAIKVSK
jgi:hypothetical protein